MSVIKTELKATIFLELTEGEAMALDAICGYGPKEFKEWFYRNMGKHYLQPFEKHLDTLFQKARSLQGEVRKVQEAREKIKTIIIP